MQNTEQDPIWHAEGNVWVHTRMVVEQLLQLPEYQQLNSEEDKLILLTAALLHDVAKPLCTHTDEAGRIVSPKHTRIGEQVVRTLLWDVDIQQRELICALVRLHGLPIWLLDKLNPNRAVISASLRLRNPLLYILVKADILGRICDTQADMLEKLEYFKELCIETEAWDTPKTFFNPHSRYLFFQKDDAYASQIYDDTRFEIIILAGVAGSGKDTYAKTLDLPMVSLDDWREALDVEHGDTRGQGQVVQKAYEEAKTFAAAKQSFIWNATNLTRQLRMRFINSLGVYNPFFRIVYLETSFANILTRRADYIPAKRLRAMRDMVEIPTLEEAHEVVILRS